METRCKHCGESIPEGRLKILPGTKTCVKCSDTKMKRSITVTTAEGEDTYNTLMIVEADQYESLNNNDLKNLNRHTPERE